VSQKRKQWALLVASLLCCVPVEAGQAEPLSFQRLGYERSVLLQGSNPRLDVTVPAPLNGLDPEASFVQLRLDPSPVLKPTSTVRVLINDELAGIFLVRRFAAGASGAGADPSSAPWGALYYCLRPAFFEHQR
jgi:hypothetical protein